MESYESKISHGNLYRMHDTPVFILLGAVYSITAWLILYQIELRLHIVARIRCRFSRHKYVNKEFGKIVKHYRCVNCGKPKHHPHLKLVEGGKKDLGTPFKF